LLEHSNTILMIFVIEILLKMTV